MDESATPHTVLCGRGDAATGLATALTGLGHRVSVTDPGDPTIDAPADMAVFVPVVPSAGPTPLVDLATADWAAAAEAPMRAALAFARACRPFVGRGSVFVAVVPTSAMGGAAGFAATATAAEGLRSLTKGIAKQWGSDGVRANTVAVDPGLLLGDAAGAAMAAGSSLADAALTGSGDPFADVAGVLDTLTAPGARFVTGSTITADGGVWMAP